MKEAIDSIQIKLNIGKLQLIIFLIILVLGAGAFLFYKFDLYTKCYVSALRADTSISVYDSADKSKVLASEITLTNTKKPKIKATIKSGDDGKATATKLAKGEYKVEARSSGYDNYSGNATLKRGKNNAFEILMTKTPPENVEISGTVKNSISEVPVEGATVTLNNEKTLTDKDGNFTFSKVITGTYDIGYSLKGYLSETKELEIQKDKTSFDLAIVPEGKVVFVSNRDKGKRGVYISNYDGSESDYLVQRKGETEDYSPLLSPNNKRVAFLSTRDGIKEDGNDRTSLYIVDIDGKNLTKIADYVDYEFNWTNDSKYLIYSSHKKNDSSTIYEAGTYNISNKEKKQIYSASDVSYSSLFLSQSGTKLAYSQTNYKESNYGLFFYDIAGGSLTEPYTDTKNINLVSFKGDSELIFSTWSENKQTYYSFNVGNSSKSEVQYEYPKRVEVKSPDGKYIAYADTRDGKNNIFVAGLTGSNERKITSLDTVANTPYWSLDSKLIFFNSQKSGESALYVVSTEGGSEKKVTDVTPDGYGYGNQ